MLNVAATSLTAKQRMQLAQLFDNFACGRLPAKPPAPVLRACHADRMAQAHVDVFNLVTTQ